MDHVPRGLLGDPQVPVQLHRGHAFKVRGQQVYGYRPLLIAELGAVHDRVGLDREELTAISAVVGHGRMVAFGSDIGAVAVGAS